MVKSAEVGKYGREVIIKFAANDIVLRYNKNVFRKLKLKLMNLKFRISNYLLKRKK